ncbi:MAG: NADH-quinone oxidoreductase subunit J, partial [Planctomycetia bacterium]|nr:NADH-quinone oxidoreductase subunit J [Planctomycetia bacterium]
QRNPARGAIAFAFVILSTCGLFLLLAAPFLMAVTIIVYAGAIIVTFLFVLMLSQTEGPSDENDRTREPLYGSLAGFAFVGLVLFTLYQTDRTGPAPTPPPDAFARIHSRLPAQVLTAEERRLLVEAIPKLEEAEKQLDGDMSEPLDRVVDFEKAFNKARNNLSEVVGGVVVEERFAPDSPNPVKTSKIIEGSLTRRLTKPPGKSGEPSVLYRDDPQARDVIARAETVRKMGEKTRKRVEDLLLDTRPPDVSAAKAEVRKLRDEVAVLAGSSELPARNVSNIGFVLYSDHLLAVELAGTLLLVATIGAVAVAQRKGVAK